MLFIPSCPGLTGLTDVCDRSDRCMPLVGFASGELLDSCVLESWCFCSVLGLFGVVLVGIVKGFPFVQVVFWECFCSRA
jgi:hypothetical protein